MDTSSDKTDGFDFTASTDELLPIVYDELRRIAASQMAAEATGHTLQPTSLVHEAFLRMVGGDRKKWQNRGHFFAAAAQAMRRILIDHARRKSSAKYGGETSRLPLFENEIATLPLGHQLLELDEALCQLAKERPEAAKIAEMRVYAGLSTSEAAQTLGIPERTARRTWQYARAWLRRKMLEISDEAGDV